MVCMTEFNTEIENLADSIEELDEYETFEDAAEVYENDESAQELLADIRILENEIDKAHQQGEDHEEHMDKHEELEELYSELQDMDVVQEYNEAAANLGAELSEVNKELSSRLGVNFAEVVLMEE